MKKNQFTGNVVEYHVLQAFPVTCLNRDDVGAPKSAVVGGTTRARISSQCWKREVRMAMRDLGVKIAPRTKMIRALVAEKCKELGATEQKADRCGEKIEKIFIKTSSPEATDDAEAKEKTDTLLFLSDHEVTLLADAFKEKKFDPEKVITQSDIKKQAKEVEKILHKKFNASLDGLDIALFGRMVAQAAELRVEAAASFSHAISTHRVKNEVEFFTAMDDYNQDPGAAHMGSLEYNSATYYRYIGVNLGQLWESLQGNDIGAAMVAFTKALFTAVPSARQTSQTGYCPWQFARVLVREGQRIQAPFETPVKAEEGGYVNPSIKTLTNFLDSQEKLWGGMYGKKASFDYGESGDGGIDELISFIKKQVA